MIQNPVLASLTSKVESQRLLQLTTPLDEGVLLIDRFDGTESLSRPFTFRLELQAENKHAAKVLPQSLIGQPMAVEIGEERDAANHRFFHGIVRRFVQVGKDERFHWYQAELVPWLWLLTQTSNCRVFQGENPLEVVMTVFKEAQRHFPHLVFHVDDTRGKEYRPQDYLVQYQETDFDFVSRLLEEEGIHYYFHHEQSRHLLVLADSPNHWKVAGSLVEYRPDAENGPRVPIATRWCAERVMIPGQHTLNDYHFQIPRNALETAAPTPIELPGPKEPPINDKLEMYDSVGRFAKRFNEPQRLAEVSLEGRRLAELRTQESEARYISVRGESRCPDFSPGSTFDLIAHYDETQNQSYLLTSVWHQVQQTPAYNPSKRKTLGYRNEFTCIPSAVWYRPERVTAKPTIQGMQTAVVVGRAARDEIDVDDFGRVQVRFHWDRERRNSCWVRVGQLIAGNRWGAMFIPRVGQEVLVSFLEGDPDRPIVTGCLYNAGQMPAYPLSKEKTKSGVKTNSSPGGAGFNELRFEDQAGKEQVFIHAQRDMDTRVRGTNKQTVGGSYHIKVGGEHTGDLRVSVGKDIHTNVAINRAVQIGENDDLTVRGSRYVHVLGDVNIKVDEALHQVTKSMSLETKEEMALYGGKRLLLSADEIEIAADTITLRGGPNQTNFVRINSDGVQVEGRQHIDLNVGHSAGTGRVTTGPDVYMPATPESPAAADSAKSGLSSTPQP